MDLSQTLLQLEQCLLSQETRRDPKEISNLIADDFIEFSASGSTWTKADLVEQLPHQPFTERTINEFAAKQLSEHTALVTYHCHTISIGQHSPPTACAVQSGVIRTSNGGWCSIREHFCPCSDL